jgi:hypothetical protein
MKSFKGYIKGKWYTLSNSEVKSNTDVTKQIGEILQSVYSQFPGGHRQFTSSDPVGTDDVDVIDTDDDSAVDAVILTQREGKGRRIHGMGTDGSKEAKHQMLKRVKEILSVRGNYTEISGRPAEILMGMGVKPIDDRKRVEAIVKRDPKVEFEWLGNGWYARTFSGGKWMKKIMVGNPL